MVVRLVAILITTVVLLASCGDDSSRPETAQESGNGGHAMDMGDDEFAFGEPADPSDADRVVDISALDSLEFDPDSVTVQVGDTVSFVVTNDGNNVHEFVLGDQSYQQQHAEDMSEGDAMAMGPNQIEIEPGDEQTLTWTFTQAGEVLYGCHEPGHYEGGMVGTIEVRS
jgi:uncharacterized cupredoxin-like copper-binding protein